MERRVIREKVCGGSGDALPISSLEERAAR